MYPVAVFGKWSFGFADITLIISSFLATFLVLQEIGSSLYLKALHLYFFTTSYFLAKEIVLEFCNEMLFS